MPQYPSGFKQTCYQLTPNPVVDHGYSLTGASVGVLPFFWIGLGQTPFCLDLILFGSIEIRSVGAFQIGSHLFKNESITVSISDQF